MAADADEEDPVTSYIASRVNFPELAEARAIKRLTYAARVDPEQLAYQLAVRGKAWSDLTSGAWHLGTDTVARLRHGEPVRPDTLAKLSRWLNAVPEVPGLAGVLRRPARRDARALAEAAERVAWGLEQLARDPRLGAPGRTLASKALEDAERLRAALAEVAG
jgi:hypothetical protein